VLAFGALWLGLATGLGRPAAGWPGWLLPMAGLVGILIADLGSGLVHWFCDSVFEEDTPLVGPLIIHPFREHHRDPLAMTQHGFLEVTGNSCLILAPVLLGGLWLLPPPGPAAPGTGFAHGVLLGFSFAAFWTNQLHKWAHAPTAPGAVAWLQRRRLVLPPSAHGQHHRPGGHAYCVLTGWMNAPLDAVAFFPTLERVMAGAGFRWFSRRDEWEQVGARGGTDR